MRFILISIAIMLVGATSFSCSAVNDPVAPESPATRTNALNSHHCMGYYQFIADPAGETLEIVPMRVVMMHLNALPFLEPPPLMYLTLESLEFNGNIIEADIGLRHPFLGLDEFTGFDVCGIFITNGSKADFDDPELRMAIDGDTRLLNPDGWSRWWNPAEFPADGTMFGYLDGLLGAPDSYAEYNCTLNGYKLFCDDLDDVTDELSGLDPSSRCVFSAGMKNVRRYTIELGAEGLIFNYAIDANWEFPQGDPPWQAPDDFGENANRPEAWNISITEDENTLWNDGVDNGGDLSLTIDVWDHVNADMNTIKVESSGNFPVQGTAVAIGGGEGYSTYEIEITDATPGQDSIELFISVESEVSGYGDTLPGEPVTAYFMHSVDVSSETPALEFHEHWAGVGYNHANICQNPNEQDLDMDDLTLVWSNTTNGSSGFKPSGIAVTDTKVFYTSQTGGSYYWPKSNMMLHCLDLATGTQIWSALINQSSDNTGRFQTSPFWYENKVYVGGDKLHCYDDVTGSLIWEYDAAPTSNLCAYPNHSPKVYDGKVYCTSRAGLFVCLDAETGAEEWTYSVGLGEMMPVTDGKRVYYPSGTTLYCNDCDSGTLLWSSPITGNAGAWSGPVIYGDRIYQNGWNGYVNCYDKLTGAVQWVYDLPGTGYALNSSPAPYTDPNDDKTVVAFGSAYSNKGIWAVKDNGDTTYTPFWNQYISSEYYDCTGLTYGDYFIVPDRYKGLLIYIDKINGTVAGTFSTGSQISAQPAIAYDRLVVATFDAVRCYMTP